MPKPFNFLGQKLILSVCLLLICSSTVRPQASGCPGANANPKWKQCATIYYSFSNITGAEKDQIVQALSNWTITNAGSSPLDTTTNDSHVRFVQGPVPPLADHFSECNAVRWGCGTNIMGFKHWWCCL